MISCSPTIQVLIIQHRFNMPKTKNKLRRLSIIVDELNSLQVMKIEDLHDRIVSRLGEYVCKSTIDKDIFDLKMDFDIDIIGSRRGVCIHEKVDFIDRLKSLLNIN